MSLAVELHKAHKERLARIDRAVAHRAICAKAAKEAAKTAELEKYLSSFTRANPSSKPGVDWFEVVEDLHPEQVRKVSVDEIQRAVCQHFGLTKIELLSRRRTNDVVIPRQIAMYFCKQLTTRSLVEIGRKFGGMDHTSVLHAIRVTEKRRREKWRIAYDIAHIEELLS